MTPPALFERERTIAPEHVDGHGHVNNLVWVEFILELATTHSAAFGFDAARTAQLGGLWVVRRQEIDYHQPAFPGDVIREQTWISTLHGARSVRHSRFLRATDAVPLLSAVTHWAYVHAKTQRPRRIDRAILEAFTLLSEPPG